MDNSEIFNSNSISPTRYPTELKWSGYCLDDGTGRNVYYVNHVDGAMSRACPPNFIQETFETGHHQYYFRGNCIRCRLKVFPSVFSKNNGSELFALNFCHNCILDTTPNLEKSLLKKGNEIWEHHLDTPKMMYMNLVKLTSDMNKRERILIDRAKRAKYEVQLKSKKYRDLERWSHGKEIAAGFLINSGCYVSWGFGKVFDEYFGDVNKLNQPHGKGVKQYSDGSIYAGGWEDGLRHTNHIGIFSRVDGYEYEGTWLSDMRHGSGIVKYPDNSTYRGEFARDLEHGHGVIHYTNGTSFDGRFRFGKRDGPGISIQTDGNALREVIHDTKLHHYEKPLPKITEKEDDITGLDFIQPESLMIIARRALSLTIRSNKHLVPSSVIRVNLPEHLKAFAARHYLQNRIPVATEKYIVAMEYKAWKITDTMEIDSIKMNSIDSETLIYFQSSNYTLKILKVIAAKLESASIEIICQQVRLDNWKLLYTLDLSFNALDLSSIRTILSAVADANSLQKLRLAGCKIAANGAHLIAGFLEQDEHLTELDLSFNTIKGTGAESIAESLLNNTILHTLNLRQNDIGVLGGKAFAELVKYNTNIKVLCLMDNGIGTDNMILISGRISSTLNDIMKSVCAKELTMPTRYREKNEED